MIRPYFLPKDKFYVKSFFQDIEDTTAAHMIEVLSLEELEISLHDYCERTSSYFVGLKRSKHFGVPINSPSTITERPVLWRMVSENNTSAVNTFSPYVVVGSNSLRCQFGKKVC